MIQDLLALPTMGGALLAGAAYAALSAFVTGPLVAERTIEKSNWPARCASLNIGATASDAPLPSRGIACGAVLGTIYGREGEAFCARYADGLVRSLDLLSGIGRQVRDAGEAMSRLQRAADTRCGCAVQAVIGERRIDFALHAGTARLVTPLAVRALDGELTRAALAPACSREEAAR